MIDIEHHFNANRMLLLIVGLWPYQKSKLARLQLICLFSILITSIIFQLATFMTSKYTTNLLIKVLPFISAYISYAIKYHSFIINGKIVKHLMIQLQRVYDDLKDSNEIAIVERYGNNAKLFTVILIIITFGTLSCIIIIQLWPDFLYIILSENQSRQHHLKIMTEYFVDQEKYFYLLLLHTSAAFVIGVIAVVAGGTMLLTYLFHVCGMFRIASYRIERAMEVYTSKNHFIKDISLLNKNKIYKDLLICAIDIHRKAMKLSEYLLSNFETSLMFLIVFGVLTLSFNLYRVFQITTFGYNTEEFLLLLANIMVVFAYMFLSNVIGQEITDHHNHIFATAYKLQWYVTPLYVQRLILFLLQRGSKSFGLNVSGLFTASLECFATLINASVSYFAVMYSVQNI